MSISSIVLRLGNLESGTAVFTVQQYNGGTAPAYTADYNTGVITFTADTEGTAYMLTARSYDVNAAAAEVWRNKAANAAKYFDFSTDNHSVKKSQFRVACYANGGSLRKSEYDAIVRRYHHDAQRCEYEWRLCLAY